MIVMHELNIEFNADNALLTVTIVDMFDEVVDVVVVEVVLD